MGFGRIWKICGGPENGKIKEGSMKWRRAVDELKLKNMLGMEFVFVVKWMSFEK